jgi:hypothetical protein
MGNPELYLLLLFMDPIYPSSKYDNVIRKYKEVIKSLLLFLFFNVQTFNGLKTARKIPKQKCEKLVFFRRSRFQNKNY